MSLALYKKENATLAQRIEEIEEDYEEKIQELNKQIAELTQEVDRKFQNEVILSEEINRIKSNYDAILDSEKAAKE